MLRKLRADNILVFWLSEQFSQRKKSTASLLKFFGGGKRPDHSAYKVCYNRIANIQAFHIRNCGRARCAVMKQDARDTFAEILSAHTLRLLIMPGASVKIIQSEGEGKGETSDDAFINTTHVSLINPFFAPRQTET